jgi:hypothetical protein
MRVGWSFGLALGFWAWSAAVRAQETPPRAPEDKKEVTFDFSEGYRSWSEDQEKARRWKNLFRRFGIAQVHIFPSRMSGPNLGPPLSIWGNGWGTSLWRDPVTGWPLQ